MKQFAEWLDKVLEAELPEETVAINFNLYDDEDEWWTIELVGTETFDLEDDDWACDEVFATRDDAYSWEEDSKAELIQEQAEQAIRDYLENGQYGEKLKQYQGVAVGFIDGALEILYTAE